MGLSSKQVISSDGLDWNQTLLQAETLELPKPPFIRRNQQQNQQQSSEPPLKCPRCDSTNTKFCYYNNYNKSQPRHFCKTCKRHWTKGGTLRNVPVGGGRKNKRLKTSKTNSKAAATTITAAAATTTATTNTTSSIINRVNPQMVFQTQQQKLSQNFPRTLGAQKSVSEIMCQAIISPPSSSSVLQQNSISNSNNGVFLGSLPQNQGLEFPYSSSSSCFDTNHPSISTCFPSSNIYNYRGDQAMEDSTITAVMPTTISSSITHNQPWQVPNTSYWNWDDIDNFVSSTDLSMPWDDSELKP